MGNIFNYGPRDKRQLEHCVVLDEPKVNDKTYRCNCDGKHVCKGCLQKERDYYLKEGNDV